MFRDGKRVAQLGAGTSVGEMAYLAPSPELKRHSTDVIVSEAATTISFTPDTLVQLSPSCRHMFHESFIRVLVRRLHVRARGARPSAADPLRACRGAAGLHCGAASRQQAAQRPRRGGSAAQRAAGPDIC